MPPAVRQRLGPVPDPWRITFSSPTPEGLSYVGRNHPLIESLAEHLVDLAFHPAQADFSPAARCGVIRTRQVTRRTTLLLLRLRYLIHGSPESSPVSAKDETPSLAEETFAWGFEGLPPRIEALTPEQTRQLLDSAQPSANVPPAEKSEVLSEALSGWEAVQPALQSLLAERGRNLQDAHARLRRLLQQDRARIEPQSPPDLLGVLVLVPALGGTKP